MDSELEFENTEDESHWTLLAGDNDEEAWIETSITYQTEEGVRGALQSAGTHAEIDNDAPYKQFAIMRDDADMFPPAPES